MYLIFKSIFYKIYYFVFNLRFVLVVNDFRIINLNVIFLGFCMDDSLFNWFEF